MQCAGSVRLKRAGSFYNGLQQQWKETSNFRDDVYIKSTKSIMSAVAVIIQIGASKKPNRKTETEGKSKAQISHFN